MMTASGQFSVSRGTGVRGSTDVPSGRRGLRLGGRLVRRGVAVVGPVRAHCVPARRAPRLPCVLHGGLAVCGARTPRTEAMRGGTVPGSPGCGAAPSIVDAVRRVGDRAKGGRARLRRAASPCSLGTRGVVERSGRGRGYRCRRFWGTVSRGSTAGVGGRVAVSLPEPGAGLGDPGWSRVPEGAVSSRAAERSRGAGGLGPSAGAGVVVRAECLRRRPVQGGSRPQWHRLGERAGVDPRLLCLRAPGAGSRAAVVGPTGVPRQRVPHESRSVPLASRYVRRTSGVRRGRGFRPVFHVKRRRCAAVGRRAVASACGSESDALPTSRLVGVGVTVGLGADRE